MISTASTSDDLAAAGGGLAAREVDERVVLYGVSWGRYVAIRELLDDVPGLRMTYLRGTLEIMSPSIRHEGVKKILARLVEIYALERDIELSGYGSTTLRKEAAERGLEPDECYVLGDGQREYPDLAIEVVLSRGAIDKLEVYRGLGVREVWIWISGRLEVYELGASGYERRERSVLLPQLDLPLLVELIGSGKSQSAIVRAFRDRLRAEGKTG